MGTPVIPTNPVDETLAQAESVLDRNLDVAEEIITRAATVAHETLKGFFGYNPNATDVLSSRVMVALISEFVKVLNSGR